MIRMEIALFLVLAFVAYSYFAAEKKFTQLHHTFSMLLVVVLCHLVFDGITVYTVNHLETVPLFLNNMFHRLFIGTMILVFYLFYQYIAILVEEETGKPRRLDTLARIYLVVAEVGDMLLPIHYAVTPAGNYSDGIHVTFCYLSVAFYFLLGTGLLLFNWKRIDRKEKNAILIACTVELIGTTLQAFNHTWLISGLGITLITLAFYLILENPDILRAELLMRLVDFFRLSVKVDRPTVTLDDEMELLEAYMELMCYRYPELRCNYDIDPDLGGAQVPNFIMQPIVENSLLHGLKNKGYRGEVSISARRVGDDQMEICIRDTGAGFEEGKKEAIDRMLRSYAKQPAKLTGNSIGILNVQKRIKLLCGQEYGLWYTENETGGVTAHIRLPLKEEAI